MITASAVSFGYDGTSVLADVDLRADSGRVVGVIGPNGSGKTTLLRVLYRSLRARRGEVHLDETPLSSLSTAQIARRLAVVAQEPSTEIPIDVSEMVLLGRAPHRGVLQGYGHDDHAIAADALRRVGVTHLAHRAVSSLSGGERRRVFIARALAQATGTLLLDEPTNHLDIRYQHDVMGLVRTLETTTVVVLHDLNLAARYCDHLVLLDRGRVVASGPTAQVLRPDVLAPVYQVDVRVVPDGDAVQLVFRPRRPPGGPTESARTHVHDSIGELA